MDIVTREEWGARPPAQTPTSVGWKERTGFMVHYSGTDVEPKPASVQAYHMDKRGWSDIGYNFLVSNRSGQIYEGRGWTALGAHCKDHNTPNIGVCVLKRGDEPLTDKAKTALRELADAADGRKDRYGGGGRLRRLCHRDVASTDCPGDQVYNWVHHGMPVGSDHQEPPSTPADDFTEAIMKQLPTMRIGDGNEKAVKTVQAIVNRDGANILVDGVWREKTDAAVRAWQAHNHVPNSVTADGHGDGIFGPASWTFALDM